MLNSTPLSPLPHKTLAFEPRGRHLLSPVWDACRSRAPSLNYLVCLQQEGFSCFFGHSLSPESSGGPRMGVLQYLYISWFVLRHSLITQLRPASLVVSSCHCVRSAGMTGRSICGMGCTRLSTSRSLTMLKTQKCFSIGALVPSELLQVMVEYDALEYFLFPIIQFLKNSSTSIEL